ncbi:unnamed protein product [Adineta steineri]|uniref:SSUH2-like protein n=1 Tax=Adineta steineri TaxID=433720 RepID=A0A813UL57_9BILA|nr:unnamed protein product [Adineta steineri]CAF4143733.1 unnamed protein product [Adineta steineri]
MARVGPVETVSPELDVMKRYVASKCCYNIHALKAATFIKNEERAAYQIDLWTLVEERWWQTREKPYSGEAILPQPHARGNVWNYMFQSPQTVLTKKQAESHDIEQTRYKKTCMTCRGVGIINCSSCDGRGNKDCWSCNAKGVTDGKHCSSCGGTGVKRCSTCGNTGKVHCYRCETRGVLLFWDQLHIKWYTMHSVSYQTNTPLPNKKIRKAPIKEGYDVDVQWVGCALNNNFLSTFPNQLDDYPVQLNKLIEQYNKKHLTKNVQKANKRIAKLKCGIQRLRIHETEYEAPDFLNKQNKQMGKFSVLYSLYVVLS